MFVSQKSLDDLLLKVFEKLQKGEKISPSKGPALELRGVLLELTNPRARLSRTETKGKIFSCLGEFLWYMSGHSSLDFIKHYIRLYEQFSDDGATIYGGYGPRLFDKNGINQYKNVVNILKNKTDSRQAVIQIFDAADIAQAHRDVPCTCTLQFFVRDNKLDLSVTMRSNDAYMGLPHDIFAFTMIQEMVSVEIEKGLGTYKHYVGSLHLYDEQAEDARSFTSEGYHENTIEMPIMPAGSPWPALTEVLELEKVIRQGKPINLKSSSLESYWLDLVKLLEIFRASKNKSLVEMERVRKDFHNDVYSIYVEAKITAIENSRLKVPELPWTADDLANGE